jgi:hypothetical protein
MRNQDRDSKIAVIKRCIGLIADPSVVLLQVVKIFLKILSFVPRYANWQNSQMQTQQQYIRDLV